MTGWTGDLVLPQEIEAGSTVEVSIIHGDDGGELTQLFADRFLVAAPPQPTSARQRAFSLREILKNPRDGTPRPDGVIAGAPHFHPDAELPIVRLLESGPTHPYGDLARRLISETDGLVLDFGAGIKADNDLYPQVVNLDAVQFRNVDVVSTQSTLPFVDRAFELVISQAVFEHLPDPFEAARQIRRVLKPGGRVLIDTAFMQPYHGDPHHYFNMTISGLGEVMTGFEILETGIQPYQQPSFGLVMELEAILPFTAAGLWRDRLETLLVDLRRDGPGFDEALGSTGRALIPAGVYVLARRPAD